MPLYGPGARRGSNHSPFIRNVRVIMKIKHLFMFEKIVRSVIAFTIGFLVGMGHPDVPVIYLLGVILIGACLFKWIGHEYRKVEKSAREQINSGHPKQ